MNRITAIEEILRAAVGIANCGYIRVDAELVVERCKYVLIMDRPILRDFAQAICRSDHLAHAHAATGQQRT